MGAALTRGRMYPRSQFTRMTQTIAWQFTASDASLAVTIAACSLLLKRAAG